ncbi:MAG: hypothetical protein ACYC0F_05080 [Rhodanobacter sp.]
MAYAIGEAVPWPVPPDWGTPVRESLAWLTDYMSARNGKRQKRQLRLAPRRTFEFTVVASADTRRLLDALGFDQGVRQWLLPIWPDGQQLAAALTAGATSVPCATFGRDFVAGGSALVWTAINQWEVLVVDAVTTSSLTLSAPTTGNWPAGARLYPLRTARTADSTAESLYTDDASSSKVKLQIDEACDYAGAAPAATYRGVPVLECRGNWADRPGAKYDRATQNVDGSTGAIAYVDLPAAPFRLQSHAWLLNGRVQQAAFRGLLYWLRGRMGTLWVPSYTADLVLASNATSSATVLSVRWAGYTVFGRQQKNRRDIRIELWTGAVFYRRITGASELSTTESLTIDSALGQAVAPADVRLISFLTLSEQAADSVSIDHLTDGDGTAQASINWAGVLDDV